MKKIRNPFAALAEDNAYNCFGCSPANDRGLHLEFWQDGEDLVAKWQPQKSFEGWTDVLHGGIQTTLMDEAAAWLVFTRLKTAGVTAALKATFQKPAFISKGEFTVRAQLITFVKQLATIKCTLADGDGTVCATGEVTCFCFPENVARKKYRYPGFDAFFAEAVT